MKNVLKAFLVITAFTFYSVSAQAQVKFGVKAGLNASNISQNLEDEDSEFDTNLRLGFHVGATADLALSDAISVQPGLLFTSKGFNVDAEEMYEDEGVEGDISYTLNYLEVPVHFAYKVSGFQVYAGPYVGFGIGGKNTVDVSSDDNSITLESELDLKPVFGEVSEDDLDDDQGAYNAFDFGVNVGVGYQFGSVLVNAGYSLGLTNVLAAYEGDDTDDKWHNRVASLSVSYFFGE